MPFAKSSNFGSFFLYFSLAAWMLFFPGLQFLAGNEKIASSELFSSPPKPGIPLLWSKLTFM
jgi:hypothetical protein